MRNSSCASYERRQIHRVQAQDPAGARRSVIVRRNGAGENLDTVRIDNDPVTLAVALAKAGEQPEVIVEAIYGWYWAADVIHECGG
jgi:hypothetical protein